MPTLPAFSISTPADMATAVERNTLIEWNPYNGALYVSYYVVHIYSNSYCTNQVYSADVGENTWYRVPTSAGLAANTTYYIRIEAQLFEEGQG